ncbi:MAG: hypothetical protein AB2L14_33295 [Candidatus Xenobiia bacterium LiM19]
MSSIGNSNCRTSTAKDLIDYEKYQEENEGWKDDFERVIPYDNDEVATYGKDMFPERGKIGAVAIMKKGLKVGPETSLEKDMKVAEIYEYNTSNKKPVSFSQDSDNGFLHSEAKFDENGTLVYFLRQKEFSDHTEKMVIDYNKDKGIIYYDEFAGK